MNDNLKVECCNGNCNQGRDCPIRKEMRKQPFNLSHFMHNLLNYTNYTVNFTLVEVLALIGIVVLLTYSYIR